MEHYESNRRESFPDTELGRIMEEAYNSTRLANQADAEKIPTEEIEFRRERDNKEILRGKIAAVRLALAKSSGIQTAKAQPAESPTVIITSPEKNLAHRLMKEFEQQLSAADGDLTDQYQIEQAITPTVLAIANRIIKLGGVPKALFVPARDRYEQIKVVDELQPHNTYLAEGDNPDLWNGGNKWSTNPSPRFMLVDAVSDVPADLEIKGTNYDKTKQWVKKYTSEGVGILEGIDPYLALVLLSLREGKPIDEGSFTVLNGKRLLKRDQIAHGFGGAVRTRFNTLDPEENSSGLRLRSAFDIKVPAIPSSKNEQ